VRHNASGVLVLIFVSVKWGPWPERPIVRKRVIVERVDLIERAIVERVDSLKRVVHSPRVPPRSDVTGGSWREIAVAARPGGELLAAGVAGVDLVERKDVELGDSGGSGLSTARIAAAASC
jgi:hypothetical protein